jgi:hypothetical protein
MNTALHLHSTFVGKSLSTAAGYFTQTTLEPIFFKRQFLSYS